MSETPNTPAGRLTDRIMMAIHEHVKSGDGGTSGKGPHDVNVPLVVVWSLISLRRFYCVYHAGDVWSAAS